jgi:hypothetical protein
MTEVGEHAAAAVAAGSDDPAALIRWVQGWLMHPFHAHLYGVTLADDAERQLQNRSVREMLGQVIANDAGPLSKPRSPERRAVGNCRHFATLATGLLRQRGVPARARCGFGAYFEPGRLVDHWVCEYWSESESRWILADPQIDDVQRRALGLSLDTLDLGRDDFWVAGQAWQRCRSGEVEPEHFGILDMWGLWFVRDNLLRDLASLCRVELLPWDAWGLMLTGVEQLEPPQYALLDHVAELSVAANLDLAAIRSLYRDHESLRVPSTILSFRPTPAPVELGELSRG